MDIIGKKYCFPNELVSLTTRLVVLAAERTNDEQAVMTAK